MEIQVGDVYTNNIKTNTIHVEDISDIWVKYYYESLKGLVYRVSIEHFQFILKLNKVKLDPNSRVKKLVKQDVEDFLK
jgi:hypothetical protein